MLNLQKIIKKTIEKNGYVYTEDTGSYKVYNEPKNWTNAREACENDGAHLAIVNSEKEANVRLHT